MTEPAQTLPENLAALAALVTPRPATVPEVIARLELVAATAARLAPLGRDDGIACFSRLYLEITQDVLAGAQGGSLFTCPGGFILDLDVAFARRYFDALDAYVHTATGSTAPACWRVLFERRQEAGTAAWRFAAAGVNAHVNFDLAFALLDVWEAHPIPLGTVEEQHADYQAINTIFRRRMDRLCEENHAPWSNVGGDGSIFDRAGNVLGDLLVVGTRDLAWAFAERMWRHHTEPGYRAVPTATLDATAAHLAGVLL